MRRKYQYVGYLYIAPWIFGLLVFQLYPFFASLYYSFTDYSMFSEPVFVGIRNYLQIFQNDMDFRNSLLVTINYVFYAVPLKLAFALLVAMILNQKLKTINFYRTVYYIPSILGGSVAVAVLWRFLFAHDGIMNQILSIVHIGPIEWLGDPNTALFTISLLTVWQFGSSMVLFLAGLKQIPSSLYEAAKIDGANRVQSFFRVTLPMLTPILFFNLVMQMINAFQEFTSAFVITNGGPMKSTYLYGMMIYDQAFNYSKMGYASALSWILFIIILIMTLIVFRSSTYWVHYEDGGDSK